MNRIDLPYLLTIIVTLMAMFTIVTSQKAYTHIVVLNTTTLLQHTKTLSTHNTSILLLQHTTLQHSSFNTRQFPAAGEGSNGSLLEHQQSLKKKSEACGRQNLQRCELLL
jgi:uncharacterized membrane protein